MKPASTSARPPVEKLRLRPGDSELTTEQILGLSLFRELAAQVEGRLRGPGGRGAVVLRRFAAGEIICRQNDPGWTAFYLLKTNDLLWLREAQHDSAMASREILARSDPGMLFLSAEQQLLKAEDLDRRSHGGAALIPLLQAAAFHPTPSELEALRAERALFAAGDLIERQLALHHPELLALDPADRRRQAEKLQQKDPDLAAKLRVLCDCVERRTRAQVSIPRRESGSSESSQSSPSSPSGRVATIAARLFGSHAKAASGRSRVVHPDGSAEPEGEQVVATLSDGELFGEMSCMHNTPRSATVRALRDCYVLEFLSIVLDILRTSESFRAELDGIYRHRVLSQHLRGISVFAHAPDEVIHLLQQRAELVTRRPGGVLFREGDPSDCLYLVRTGTVKLFRSGSGDRVLDYRFAGDVVGERGLYSGEPRDSTCAAYEHPRLEQPTPGRELPGLPVELVRIDRALFEEVCARFPAFRAEVQQVAGQQSAEGASDRAALAPSTSRFGALGLMQGRKLLLIDQERCTSCDDCVSACASVHQDGLPRLARQGPRFGKYQVPTSCRQCTDPVCLIGCPVRAIHQGAAGQIVIESWCISCGLCATQCPYGAIELPFEGRSGAVVCDQCATIKSGPQCVHACPHDAALRVDASAFFARTRVG